MVDKKTNLHGLLGAPVAPPAMDEARAREILGSDITPDGALSSGMPYAHWTPRCSSACLDGDFSADELEAIAWWMRNKCTATVA